MIGLSQRVSTAAFEAVCGRPIGERHLIGVLERGANGTKLATVTIAQNGRVGIRFTRTNTMIFESWAEARAFVSSWVWYQVTRRRSQPKGTPS